MASRDVWSHGGGEALRELLWGSLAALLLQGKGERPLYVSSPWVSDFPLFANAFRQFAGLFPELADEPVVRFSGYLGALARLRPVRLITVRNPTSEGFADALRAAGVQSAVRYAPETYHEKGLLGPSFYVEGSMNITYSGVYVRGEKITYHSDSGDAGRAKIARAYLEFERRWENLPPE
jgi:hypothetical protein